MSSSLKTDSAGRTTVAESVSASRMVTGTLCVCDQEMLRILEPSSTRMLAVAVRLAPGTASPSTSALTNTGESGGGSMGGQLRLAVWSSARSQFRFKASNRLIFKQASQRAAAITQSWTLPRSGSAQGPGKTVPGLA